MGILCGHCGERHPTVAQVRSCAGAPAAAPVNDDPPFDEPIARQPVPGTEFARRGGMPSSVLPEAFTVERLAGPDALGRSVVVARAATAPTPWSDCERVTVGAGARDDVVAVLQAAWSTRQRLVIELDGDIEPTPTLDVPWWEWSPDLELRDEHLAHLVFANSVDARDPATPLFGPLALALAAGASPTDAADVVCDLGPAWCDGGPLDHVDPATLGGGLLLSAPGLAIGSLAPLRSAPSNRAGLTELAPDQLAAVTHRGGGARIIAPAGSGKTRVLTERARHLVTDLGIDPRSICLVAFNVRAREEMQERTADLAGLEVRTLNSLALAICNGTGPFAAPSAHRRVEVVDEMTVRRMLDAIVPVRRQAMSDPIAAWIEALTATRLGLRAPRAVETDFGGDVKDFAQLGPRYVDELGRTGRVDFDQQIIRAIDILLTDPVARGAARRQCAILLVDEFQDLTPAHLLLVRLLAGPRADVFGVGDDDQTIYGYSGASPEWLIDFADLFPGSGRHDLEVNYRCPPAVVEAAATLLSHNRRRVDKVIRPRPGRADTAEPDGTGSLAVLTTDQPIEAMVDRVRSLVDRGVRPRDIAVLARVNATLLAPLVALDDAGIACSKPVDVGFCERTGVAGALAWLALATAPAGRLPSDALDIAARRPPRSLSSRVLEWLAEKQDTRELRELARRLREERDTAKVNGFVDHVELVRSLAESGATTKRLLEAIRDRVGLGGALDNRLDASRRAVDRSSHGDDLTALLSIAELHPDPADFGSWLAARLAGVGDDPGGVRLATVHKVKGREWPHVIVYEATAGLMPHRLAEQIEEERRVFHVAITRCSASVTVVAGQPPSPFITQMTVARDPSAAEPEPVVRARPITVAGEKSAARGRTRQPAPEASSIDVARRREQLRAWRSERSRRDGVPAYVVFSDATLYELAEYCPTSTAALLDISGIGPAKAERYGDELVELLGAPS